MRGGLILFAVLFSAVSGYRPTNFLRKEQQNQATHAAMRALDDDDLLTNNNKDTTLEPLDSSTLNVLASSSSAQPIQAATQKPQEVPMDATGEQSPLKPPEPLITIEPADESTHEENRRRLITYDQRQEGQYNLRADLENFMFVFVPSSSASGLNLLDLLSKSNSRRSATKAKRKNFFASSPLAISKPLGRYQQDLKAANSQQQHYNYWSRHQPDTVLQSVDSSRAGEFIEGRTPYHVDISANDEEHSRLHTDQVEVLPPPVYPFTHLIKPYYHLEAEPTVIQALPPPLAAVSHAHGPESFLSLSPAAAKAQSDAELGESAERSPKIDVITNSNNNNNKGYYRLSRAIRHNDFVDSNRVPNSPATLYGVRRTSVPIYRSEYSSGASQLYPPIDVPRFVSLNVNDRLDDQDDIQNLTHDHHIGEIIVPSVGEDDIDLSGSIFIDAEAKALLSDGMARCAPGRRRDSYGVCREIEGY